MHDRTDAGQVTCRTGQWLSKTDACKEECRTRLMQYKTDAGQFRCRTGQMLYRADVVQDDCKTGLKQDRADAGQNGCSAGQDLQYSGQISGRTRQMRDRTDAGQEGSRTWRLQDRPDAGNISFCMDGRTIFAWSEKNETKSFFQYFYIRKNGCRLRCIAEFIRCRESQVLKFEAFSLVAVKHVVAQL